MGWKRAKYREKVTKRPEKYGYVWKVPRLSRTGKEAFCIDENLKVPKGGRNVFISEIDYK